ncbi:MAG: amidase [Sandaracinaceae bacterium]|nr:amidase [Sandaracinaceae bacterium]
MTRARSELDVFGSALEQARAIRERRVGSEELVAHYLDRIDRLDGQYAAFPKVFRRRARLDARAKDRRRAAELPPFFGVPVGVKDLHFLRGDFTRMGSRAYEWLLSPYDDVTVRALKRAGFVIVGKTSTSELALLPVVEPDIHPPTRNPWDPSRTSGGSSGGAAAAVAAGMLPIAPGSDGGGSIRIPAAVCGLFGHKPSRGLVPNPHAPMDELGMTAIGPLAQGVEDGAALLDVLAGRAPGAPQSFLALARARPPRMTVGVLVDSPLGETDAARAEAAEAAGRALAALGHRVVACTAPATGLDDFMPIYQRLLSRAPVIFESRLQPLTRWFRAEGRRVSREDARARHERLSAICAETFGDVDVMITPTTPIAPPRIGAFRALPPEEAFRRMAHLGAFTAAGNLTGAPGATVPWSLVDGLPAGVQLLGRPGEDARVLALALELERHRPDPPGRAPIG